MEEKQARMTGWMLLPVAILALCAAPLRAQSASEKLFKAKCLACHGADGKGDTAAGKKLGARDFSAPEVRKETDAELVDIVTKGKNKMPGYDKKISDKEIRELVAFLRELGKKK